MDIERRNSFRVAQQQPRAQASLIATSGPSTVRNSVKWPGSCQRKPPSPLEKISARSGEPRPKGSGVKAEGLPPMRRRIPVSKLTPVERNDVDEIGKGTSANHAATSFSSPPLLPLSKREPLPTLRESGAVARDGKCTKSTAGVAGSGSTLGGRMAELRVIHSTSRPSVVENQVPVTSTDTAAAAIAPVATCRTTEHAQFQDAIEILNRMMDVDTKDMDRRAWVTRFTEGKAEAQLGKEPLLPVLILVNADSVMAIDLNGTSQHHNYAGVCAPRDVCLPLEGGIVFPLKNALADGEVVLPKSDEEVKMMMLTPVTDHIRWGHPIGVLFLGPMNRASIVRDICQKYLPSFLREAYPTGVPLKGHWMESSPGADSTKPRVMRIEKNVQEFVFSCMERAGGTSVRAFMGDGNRLGVAQLVHRSRQQRKEEEEKSPLLIRDEESRVGNDEATLVQRQQQDGEKQQNRKQEEGQEKKEESCNGHDGSSNEVQSPWESNGKQLIFTARLFTSGVAPSHPDTTLVCRALLLLTPHGPLELIAKPPFSLVTVKDVKLSLLRSGLGRSLRLHQDAFHFIYAPAFPVLDDDAVIDARYAVLRLQTRR